MLNNRKIRTLFNVIGVVASILLALFLVYALVLPHDIVPEIVPETSQNQGEISFKSEELVFDGSDTLDLMEGVYIDDGKGNDITSEGSAVITAEGTIDRKIVSYSCIDAAGNMLTAKRVLIMEGYTGPTLEVPRTLALDAENTDNLIAYLQSENLLVAYDGFGKNITTEVTHQRERTSKGYYKMTFRIVNDYGDEKTVSVNAKITGEVSDPDFELYDESISVRKDITFEPMKYVVSRTSNVGNIITDSSVNTTIPGEYRVIYTAYSTDKTVKTTKVMNVTVKD